MRGVFIPPLSVLFCFGCVEPDLGEVPFYCNHGQPACPEGYICVDDRCVLEGFTAPDGSSPDIRVPDQFVWPDLITLDGSVPDRGGGDGPPSPADHGIDTASATDSAPKPDGPPPHLGCQGNQDCTDSSSPCCCPTPLLPMIWTCLPLCPDPLCF